MQCEKFERLLNDALDERTAPQMDAEIAAHVRSCAPCRETLAACDALFDGLEMRIAPEPSEHFLDRVMAGLVNRPLSAKSIAVAAAGLVIAASLLIAILPRFFPAPGLADEGNDLAGTNPAAVGLGGLPGDETSPLAFLASGEETYRSMLRTTGRQMAPLPSTVRYTATLDGVRPVADSVSAVLHALRRTLPAKPAETES